MVNHKNNLCGSVMQVTRPLSS